MALRFVLLEITDQEISGLINWIRNIVSEGKVHTGVHLTIRGPYSDTDPDISKGDVEKWTKMLAKQPLLIGNVGVFDNKNECIVYFRVEHPELQKIWWKPDYPVKEFGFNPHISLYVGKDKYFAETLAKFLKKEKIELLCNNFKLITYSPKQEDLFNSPNTENAHPLDLVNKRKVSITFLSRLSKMVEEHRKVQKELPLTKYK